MSAEFRVKKLDQVQAMSIFGHIGLDDAMSGLDIRRNLRNSIDGEHRSGNIGAELGGPGQINGRSVYIATLGRLDRHGGIDPSQTVRYEVLDEETAKAVLRGRG